MHGSRGARRAHLRAGRILENARRAACQVGWIQVSGPAETLRRPQRRLDVIADDYLPMSDIIA